jgi:hypothetical protein
MEPVMRARRCVAFVVSLALVLLSVIASAQDVQPDQTIEVLVSTAPGAPTADDLVNYYRGPHLPPPPLHGFMVGDPLSIAYLMPLRPQGDFLAYLEAHPDSAEAQLYRYVVVIYPHGTDLAAPLAALRADPYVMAAYLALPGDFSTPPDSEPPVIPSGQPASAPTLGIAGLASLLAVLIGAVSWSCENVRRVNDPSDAAVPRPWE